MNTISTVGETVRLLGGLGIIVVVVALPMWLGLLRRNMLWGARTHAALASEENWRIVNRATGRVGVLWGLVLVALAAVAWAWLPEGLGRGVYASLVAVPALAMAAHVGVAALRAERPLHAGGSTSMLTSDGAGAAVQTTWAPGVIPATNLEPAEWIAPAVLPFDRETSLRVGSVIPTGFDAYVRIDHGHLTGIPDEDLQVEGSIPRDLIAPVVAVLRGCTTTPEHCWFALWEGWGDVPPVPGPLLHLPGRRHVLLRASLDAVTRPLVHLDGSAGYPQTPQLWWPRDRAWCVATEIDLPWTYVGGDEECIARLADDPRLRARRVSPEDPA